MKYYIIAGEASGDLHGANLLKELKTLDTNAELRGWGGDLMEDQGMHLVKHYRELAFMGFAEVILNLRTILSNIKICKEDIKTHMPDAIILIDYPGFNLRIAEFAKKLGIKVYYYICPQVWAWKENRVKKLKRDVDELYTILPFEKPFYAKHNMEAHFVGNPLLDAIKDYSPQEKTAFYSKNKLDERPIIAVLPGSRKQEILKKLPVMLSMVKQYPQYQFVIGAAPSQEAAFYESIIGNADVKMVADQTYDLYSYAVAGMVTSGTATLEAALFELPEVVCYEASTVSYAIAKRLVNIKYISLVNLIMDQEIVTELIQNDFNSKRLKEELDKLLNPEYKAGLIEKYKNLKANMGSDGASSVTANLLWKNLTSTK